MKTEKIQKILSDLGFGSRRYIETQISLGTIYINNQIVIRGSRFNRSEIKKIKFQGKKIQKLKIEKKNTIQILKYYKPTGEICTSFDIFNRPTVFKNLPNKKNIRWIMIGRLDYNTSGLLLFTNSGKIAYRLMHPKYEIEREYLVYVYGNITIEKINILKKGIFLENVFCFFKKIIDLGGSKKKRWFKIVLSKGYTHEVRRLWFSINILVLQLKRIRFGNLKLCTNLLKYKFLFCKKFEIKRICNLIKILKK
ncbi:pseudouridine synthase [Buchnera aphidicola]|uniref:pseudouridine synthase n=1 Tax=Buchnera aphidicola TaxID=9 RepID=UPI0031B707B0